MSFHAFDFIDSPEWDRGQSVEDSFKAIMDRKGITYREASRDEQFLHFDYKAKGTIDVKARKKINRSDEDEQDDLVWVEFKNTAGNAGWLTSDVDFIAFERKDDFVVVRRHALLELANEKCNRHGQRPSDALYKGYQRRGRLDLISIIKMQDILQLPVTIEANKNNVNITSPCAERTTKRNLCGKHQFIYEMGAGEDCQGG